MAARGGCGVAALLAAGWLAGCGPGPEACPRPVPGEARTGRYVLRPGTATAMTEVTVDLDRDARTLTMSYRDAVGAGGRRYVKRYRLLTPP